MSDGIAWAREQEEQEALYRAHVASGRLDKGYLESDISRLLTKEEIRQLVTRLIIHQLGGFKKYLQSEGWAASEVFEALTKQQQKTFLMTKAEKHGYEIDQTKKLAGLRRKVESLSEAIEAWRK